MNIFTAVCTFAVLSLCPVLVQAQIISQNPSPEVQTIPEAEVETLKTQPRPVMPGHTIQTPRPAALLFAGFDTNGDYLIDLPERSTGIKQAFKKADRNGDGRLSLIELEAWRVEALGSEHAAPGNFAFAPNFARSVSQRKFTEVLSLLADKLDMDKAGHKDGIIHFSDLLKDRPLPHARKTENNCLDEVMAERRRVEQQCRTRRGY